MEENKNDEVAALMGLEAQLDINMLLEDTIQMHEMFTALCRAGFTENQALKLVALLTEQMGSDAVFIV